MSNNKSIKQILDCLENIVGKFLQIKDYEKVLEELSVTNATTIKDALSIVKPKQPNT